MNKLYYFLFLIMTTVNLYSKILICTFAYNRPDFIEIQYLTFTKFIKEEFKFTVFNDARDKVLKTEIDNMCKKYGIDCITIPQEIHARPYLNTPQNPWYPTNIQAASVRNCNVVQYAMDTIGFAHDDYLLLVDSDLFLIKEFNFEEFLKDHHAASFLRPCSDVPKKFHDCAQSHPQEPGITYFWIGLVILNMKTLPNKYALSFSRGIVQAPFGASFVDSGGYSYYFKSLAESLRVKSIDKLSVQDIICNDCKINNNCSCSHNVQTYLELGLSHELIDALQKIPLDPRKEEPDRGIELFNSGAFLHFRSASNWNNAPINFLKLKNDTFNALINLILED